MLLSFILRKCKKKPLVSTISEAIIQNFHIYATSLPIKGLKTTKKL